MTWLGANVIETASGRSYDFLAPDPSQIVLEDVAHALGNICRFAGHTRSFYSVAQHSVFVSKVLEAWGEPAAVCRAGLLHDAHEAYVWDAPAPIKPLLGEAFSALADTADEAIATAFGIDVSLLRCPAVKKADLAALFYEGNHLMTHGPGRFAETEAVPVPENLNLPIDPWHPDRARRRFCSRAHTLGVDGG